MRVILQQLIILTLLIGITNIVIANELRPFVSDGCSSFPDGPPAEPDKWRNCCFEHDKAYWLGGTSDERSEADQKLKTCIAKVENKALAEIMWAGVRAGGSPYWPTSYRWSYGWPYTRGYQAVSDEERRQAELLLEKYRHE